MPKNKKRIIEVNTESSRDKVDQCRAQLIELIDEARTKPFSEKQALLNFESSLIDILKSNIDINEMLQVQEQEQAMLDMLFNETLTYWKELTGSSELLKRYQPSAENEATDILSKIATAINKLTKKSEPSPIEIGVSSKEYSLEEIARIRTYVGQLKNAHSALKDRFDCLYRHILVIVPSVHDELQWMKVQKELRTQLNEFVGLAHFLDYNEFEKMDVKGLINKLLLFIPAFFNELSQSTIHFDRSKLEILQKTLLNHLGEDASYLDKGIRYLKPNYQHQPADIETIYSLLENILPIKKPENIALLEIKQYAQAINYLDQLKSMITPLKDLKNILVLQRADSAQFEKIATLYEEIKTELARRDRDLNELAILLEDDPRLNKEYSEIKSAIRDQRNTLLQFWAAYQYHREAATINPDIKARLETLTIEQVGLFNELKTLQTKFDKSARSTNRPFASSSITVNPESGVPELSVNERLRFLRNHYVSIREKIAHDFEVRVNQTYSLHANIVACRKEDLIRLDLQSDELKNPPSNESLKDIRTSIEPTLLIMEKHIKLCRTKLANDFGAYCRLYQHDLEQLVNQSKEKSLDLITPFLENNAPLLPYVQPLAFTDLHSESEIDNYSVDDQLVSGLFSEQNPFKIEFEDSYTNAEVCITKFGDSLSKAKVCKPEKLLEIARELPGQMKASKTAREVCVNNHNYASIMEDRLKNSKPYAESLKIINIIRDEFTRIYNLHRNQIAQSTLPQADNLNFEALIRTNDMAQLVDELNRIDGRLRCLLEIFNTFIAINNRYISKELIAENNKFVPALSDNSYLATIKNEVETIVTTRAQHLSDSTRTEFTQWIRNNVLRPLQLFGLILSELFGGHHSNGFFVTALACRTERQVVGESINILNTLNSVDA